MFGFEWCHWIRWTEWCYSCKPNTHTHTQTSVALWLAWFRQHRCFPTLPNFQRPDREKDFMEYCNTWHVKYCVSEPDGHACLPPTQTYSTCTVKTPYIKVYFSRNSTTRLNNSCVCTMMFRYTSSGNEFISSCNLSDVCIWPHQSLAAVHSISSDFIYSNCCLLCHYIIKWLRLQWSHYCVGGLE